MLGYLGKALAFICMACPLMIGLLALHVPHTVVMIVWVASGILGRETLGRRLDEIDREDEAEKRKQRR